VFKDPAVGDTAVVDSSQADPRVPLDSIRHPNLPEGYRPIVDRPFNTLAGDPPERGTGSFPAKTGGSEGWDDVERKYAKIGLASDTTSPLSPGGVMRFTYSAGVVPPGKTYNPGVAQTQGFTGPAHGKLQYRKLYLHFAFKLDPGFQYNPAGIKLLFMRSNSTHGGKFEPLIAITQRSNLVVNCQGCEDNARETIAANMGPSFVSKGAWHRVEAVLEMNSAFGVGDGILRIWLDGVLTHSFNNIKFLRDGANAWFWDTIHVAPTWGGQGGTIVNTQAMYLDHTFVAGR